MRVVVPVHLYSRWKECTCAMRTVEDLPIMPLNSVLFPGAPVTLYIHEERYRKMLDRAIEGEGHFGVVLLREGNEVGGPCVPHEIGTIVRISEVTNLPDGSSMVLAEGGDRFRITEIRSAMPLLRADVELLDEKAGVGPEGLHAVERARQELETLVELVLRTMGADGPPPELPDDPVHLSYTIAANLQISLGEQQQLLEAESAAARLRATTQMMQTEITHYRVMAAAREKLDSLGITDGGEELPFSRS